MGGWLTNLCARLILVTKLIDKGYQFFVKVRSGLVLIFATEAMLNRFNDLAYSNERTYNPDSPLFRQYLFPWEERVIESHFPPPPARILIGGAGGGREAFALARKGYRVVAFEPSSLLSEALAARVGDGMDVKAYRGRYEDMPKLFPARQGATPCNLDEAGPFDAAIVGWISFSHLTSEERRVETLKAFGKATRGPVLVSFHSFSTKDSLSKPGRWRKLLQSIPGRLNRDPGNIFSISIGFCHDMNEAELKEIARKSGLKVIYLNEDDRDTNWPHAVLVAEGVVPT